MSLPAGAAADDRQPTLAASAAADSPGVRTNAAATAAFAVSHRDAGLVGELGGGGGVGYPLHSLIRWSQEDSIFSRNFQSPTSRRVNAKCGFMDSAMRNMYNSVEQRRIEYLLRL